MYILFVYEIFNLFIQQTELKWIKISIYERDSADHQSAPSRLGQSHTSANQYCSTFSSWRSCNLRRATAFLSRLKPRPDSRLPVTTEFPNELFIYSPPLPGMLIVSVTTTL